MASTQSLTYGSYLRLDEVLQAQHPVAPPELGSQVQAAEHFFIVVHQAFELWFKQELLDLRLAADALQPPTVDPELALDYLLRVASIQRLLFQQMVLFDHLPPRLFLSFRPYLGTATGAESEQFRAMRKALGLWGETPSPVYEAFSAALVQAGLTLEALYQDPSRGGALYRVAEALVDISEGFWLLEAAHLRIAERTIGQRPGTGGTSGVPALTENLARKAFPQLWDVRTKL